MLFSSLKETRQTLGAKIASKLLPEHFCILSDDCWGGQIYRQYKIPYNTPTVGLYVEPADYIRFVENIAKPDACDMEFIKLPGYTIPIAQTPYARLYFQHYKTEEEARTTFLRRYERIDWDNLFIKIDFGKSYTQADIDRWNELKIKRSIALYPPDKTDSPIWHGVQIDKWMSNGAAQFDNTRRYVNIFRSIQDGTIERTFDYQLLNFLVLDPGSWRWLKRSVNPNWA